MKTKSVKGAVRGVLALTASAAIGLPAAAQEAGAEGQGMTDIGGMPAAILEEVVVTGRQRSVAEDVFQERLESDVVVDIVSSEQISRVGDSNVSLALRRMPGVTLVGDQFVYIRGLGERYSSTTLNGAYVPSPDLTRNVIPLDLFPAEIVQSLSIQKTYSADKSAAFGGGNVDIRTRGIPEDLVFVFNIGSGWNSDSGDEGITYRGGGDDELGTDDGTRALPGDIRAALQQYEGNISPTGILQVLSRDGQFHSLQEAQGINRELALGLYRDVEQRSTSMDPDLSLQAGVGNSWIPDETGLWKLGFLALGDYSNQWRNRERIERSATYPEDVNAESFRSTNQVTLTGALGFGVDFAEEHRVEADLLYLRNTEDDTVLQTSNTFNFQQETGLGLRQYDYRFEERELELLQLRGSHTLGTETLGLLDFIPLGFAEGLTFDWYWSDATATTDLPTELTISAVDQVDPVTGSLISTSLRNTASTAFYRYTDLQDEVTSFGTKLTMPFEFETTKVALSGGYDYYEKGRRYVQVQFGLGADNPAAGALVGTPGNVLADASIIDPANDFELQTLRIGTESYLAAETVTAVFGALDATWNETWRLSAGLRWEDFERVSIPVDPLQYDPAVGKILVPPDQLASLARASDDYYPAVALTYMRPDFWAEDFQLRFGWSQTVARPDLREVAAATYIDPLTETKVSGNPLLVDSELSNFDLRGEWFFGNGNNFTTTLFYKDIKNPIETVQAGSGGDLAALTFVNAESGEVYGIEFEGLAGLGFLTGGGWSERFFVSGNVTLSDSELVVGDAAPNLTNDTRRLSQHSQYVANLQFGYDSDNGMHSASLAYTVYGERLFFAGRGGAPDSYEQPFHSVDLIYSLYPTERLSLKLRLQNLLDEQIEIQQGDVVTLEQTVGVTARLDLAYRF